MTNREWAEHQLSLIDLWYNTKRNEAHAKLWKGGDSNTFKEEITGAQEGRFDSLRALFSLIQDKELDDIYVRAVDPLECLRTYDGRRT